jgi:endo-1,4-beta-xylanase
MKNKQILFLLLAILVLLSCNSPSSGGRGGGNNSGGGKSGGGNTYEAVDMMTLSPLKDQFASHFMIGNIFNPIDVSSTVTNKKLTHHYNVLTAENNMKPGYLSPSQGSYSWTTADQMVNAARASGFKVVGHTLLWHSQNAGWMNNVTGSGALSAMKSYVTDVVTHFKGKIYSWDVLNEVFPDSVSASSDWKTVMRNENPWFKAIGSDFVYEGFLAARLADPDAILYYNDYNLDQNGKATMVRNMVHDVNERYKTANPGVTRNLIEGIGMQSHHNINVSASAIRSSLDLFKPLGVIISITELDILSQSWSEFSSNSALTENGKLQAANLYGECFKLFVQNKDIIERVTFWGVYDEQSWRARAKPLLFEGSLVSKAKPAYYKVIAALD